MDDKKRKFEDYFDDSDVSITSSIADSCFEPKPKVSKVNLSKKTMDRMIGYFTCNKDLYQENLDNLDFTLGDLVILKKEFDKKNEEVIRIIHMPYYAGRKEMWAYSKSHER